MSFPLPVAFHSDGRGGHGAVALRYLDTRLPVDHATCIHLELQIGSTLDAGQVIAVELGPTGYAGRSPIVQRLEVDFVRWHEPDDSRVSRPDLRGPRGEIPRAYSALAA